MAAGGGGQSRHNPRTGAGGGALIRVAALCCPAERRRACALADSRRRARHGPGRPDRRRCAAADCLGHGGRHRSMAGRRSSGPRRKRTAGRGRRRSGRTGRAGQGRTWGLVARFLCVLKDIIKYIMTTDAGYRRWPSTDSRAARAVSAVALVQASPVRAIFPA